ncbi:MAG: hypothetical protein IT497_03655 [Ottowia sp.]|nr:hypothetical protein [Ottowia sp.]
MDLQTERRLEQFFYLARLPIIRMESRMEVVDPPFRLYVESQQDRVVFAVVLPIDKAQSFAALSALLERCIPERTQGIPMRCFLSQPGLTISCSPDPEFSPEAWFSLYSELKKMLSQAKGSA